MSRRARVGEIRSNIHAGGFGEKIELTEIEKELSIRAAKTIGLEIAGVDIIRSERGPLVLEVNANPGFEGLEKTTGLDVAGGIIDFAVS
jgi:ribosomal protein S6--L-glutamate ligase